MGKATGAPHSGVGKLPLPELENHPTQIGKQKSTGDQELKIRCPDDRQDSPNVGTWTAPKTKTR